MQTNLLFTGREYYSLENCLVTEKPTGVTVTATIIGSYERKLYKVAYHIETNEHWETVFFEITSRHSNQQQVVRYEGDGQGNWKRDGVLQEQFSGCIDIDIPLTPFTNTLPIRRLQLQPGETKEIQVLYCDMLEQTLYPVRQKYVCLSATEYHYENIPNDFEATIQVDAAGLVIDYPELFVRSMALQTDYR